MLNTAEIKQLKQVNVSRDADKTKSRIKEVYKPAKRAEKQAVINLSGQAPNSLYRAERTGNASAKIIVPLAQIMNVSPAWLAGMTDEKDVCTDEAVEQFLTELGYAKLLNNAFKAADPTAKAPKAPKAAKKATRASKSKKASKAAKTPKAAPEAVADAAPKPAVPAKPKKAPANAMDVLTITISNDANIRKAADSLDLDSAHQLLTALYLRANVGGEARKLCEAVKYCLLS